MMKNKDIKHVIEQIRSLKLACQLEGRKIMMLEKYHSDDDYYQFNIFNSKDEITFIIGVGCRNSMIIIEKGLTRPLEKIDILNNFKYSVMNGEMYEKRTIIFEFNSLSEVFPTLVGLENYMKK